MASGSFFDQSSFFVQSQEAALRHISLLAKSLKKLAIAGLAAGVGCSVMAVLLSRFLIISSPQSNAPLSGIAFIAWFMAVALFIFSGLYFVAGWGLTQQKSWARYMAAGTFLAKLLLCIWLGRGSFVSMVVFLLLAGWDMYGLWVLLSKQAGQLLNPSESNQVIAKPANLVT